MSETGAKTSKKELRKIAPANERKVALENEKKLASARDAIKELSQRARWIEGVSLVVLGVIILIGAAGVIIFLHRMDTVDKRVYNDLRIEKWRVEHDLAKLDSMFHARECTSAMFSGARVVTASQAVRGGGPIACKCGGGFCVDAKGRVDPSFPASAGCSCANSAWAASGIPFFNVTDEASAPVQMRCSMHPDGRLLRDSCVLYVHEEQPTFRFFCLSCWFYYLLHWIGVSFLKMSTYSMCLLSLPLLVLILGTLEKILKDRAEQEERNRSNESKGTAAPHLQTKKPAVEKRELVAQVFDVEANHCVPIEWKNLPTECVRAAVSSTKRHICFCRHGDLIYVVDSDDPPAGGMTYYLNPLLREVHSTPSTETPEEPLTVQVYDTKTRFPSRVELKDLPNECMCAAISSTAESIRICKDGDVFYVENRKEPIFCTYGTIYRPEQIKNMYVFELGGPKKTETTTCETPKTISVFDLDSKKVTEIEWSRFADMEWKNAAVEKIEETHVRLHYVTFGSYGGIRVQPVHSQDVPIPHDGTYYHVEYLRRLVKSLNQ